LPGGSVLGASFDTSLLLDTDFAQPSGLYPVDRGPRPKGWRAAPVPSDEDHGFGVRLSPRSDAANAGTKFGAKRHALIGVGTNGGAATVRVARGERAILAQEMRNPRAGRFTFTVEACIAGRSRAACELFQKNFACRLVIYRFTTPDKNPLQRQEFGSLAIDPPLVVGDAPACSTFEFSRVLDGAGPGQNFSIGLGLGVSIEVEKTSEGTWEVSGAQAPAPAALYIAAARLTFASRTINDKVVA